MLLVEIDVIGLQPPQARLDGFHDVAARQGGNIDKVRAVIGAWRDGAEASVGTAKNAASGAKATYTSFLGTGEASAALKAGIDLVRESAPKALEKVHSGVSTALKLGETWGPRAARVLGLATSGYGAWNQASDAYRKATPNVFNKEAAATFTFVAGIVGGFVDDVAMGRDLAFTGGTGYTQVAMDTFQRENGSPLQVGAKEFFVWLSQF
jgi:hypothetical protein